MREQIHDLVHSFVQSALIYVKENPRNILKVVAKVTAATNAALSGALSMHGWPLAGGISSAIAAGAVCLDGWLSDSSGKGGAE
jgi:hypothetical protein